MSVLVVEKRIDAKIIREEVAPTAKDAKRRAALLWMVDPCKHQCGNAGTSSKLGSHRLARRFTLPGSITILAAL